MSTIQEPGGASSREAACLAVPRKRRPGSLVVAGVILLALFGPTTAVAQGVTARASIDRPTAAVGESVTYVVEIVAGGDSGGHSEPVPPKVDGLAILPSGTSNNIQIIDGDMSVTRTHQFSVIPQRAGSFTIPSYTIELNGRQVTVNAVSLQAVGATPPQTPQGEDGEPSEPQPRRSNAPTDVDPNALFLRVRLHGASARPGKAGSSEKSVYQGQPLVYTSRLYSQYSLGPGTGLREQASFPGFLVENQQVDARLREVVERNARFHIADISNKILVPTRSGTTEIKPETLQVALRTRRRRAIDPFDSFGSFFDDDFFFSRQVVTKLITALPLKVEVSPLPAEGRPPGFSGTVGSDFVMSSTLDKQSVKENDVFTVKLTIRGSGDVRSIPEPKVDLGSDFKLYPTKGTSKVDPSETGLAGSKTFELVLAPRTAGEKTIPAFEFSYFDVKSASYRTLKTEPLKVAVQPGEKEEALSSAQFERSAEVKVLGRDIQYIREAADRMEDFPDLARSPSFLAGNLSALLVLGTVWLWDRRRRRLEQDVSWARSSRAHPAARRDLGQLSEEVERLDARAFHARIERIVLEYLAGKANLEAAGFVVDRIEEALTGRPISPALLGRLKDLLEECEQARFAPVAAVTTERSARQAMIERVKGIVDELEEVLS